MTDTYPADTLADMARWLLAHLDRLRVHPAAGEAVEEITSAVREVERVIDRPPDKAYAGPCEYCGTDLLATPGSAVARCRTCGAEYDVDEQNAWMRHQLEDRLFTASEAAGMCHWLRIQVSYETIRYYARQGYVLGKGTNPRGHEMYRFGDILDAKSERDGLQRVS